MESLSQRREGNMFSGRDRKAVSTSLVQSLCQNYTQRPETSQFSFRGVKRCVSSSNKGRKAKKINRNLLLQAMSDEETLHGTYQFKIQ